MNASIFNWASDNAAKAYREKQKQNSVAAIPSVSTSGMPGNKVTTSTQNANGTYGGLSTVQADGKYTPPQQKAWDTGSSGFSLNGLGIGAKAGDFLAGIGSSLGGEKYGSFSEDEQAAQSAIRSGLEMIPGYGTAIAAATGLVDAVGSATGLNLSSVDSGTAKKAGIWGSEFNKVMNMLPGNSMIWGGLSALFGNKRTNNLEISDDVLAMSDGFAGTVGDLQSAKDLSGKRLFFNQTNKANDYINSQSNNLAMLNRIQTVNTQRKQSDYYQDLQNQNINRYAGQNYLGTHVGKNGMKLMSLEEAKKIVAMKKVSENEDVTKLQNGGNIPGIDTNILPEGALHKERHHLEDVNSDLEDATKKGIPVMAAEGGEISEQVAEIERDEIVFRLEVTKKLEELMKDGSEEAMIEAGKLVAQEVIENTQDNTGQITEENGNSDSDNKQ